jgi:hypothetical protein
VPKGKKIKVLTHQPRYIETAIVPKFDEGTSSTAEAEQAAPAGRSTKESAAVPKVSATGSAEVLKQTAKAKGKTAKKPDREETTGPLEPELPKVAKTPAITTKRRRMASVLDAVMETTKALTPAPARKVAEAMVAHAETEAEPSVPMGAEPTATKRAEQESLDTAWLWRRMRPKKLNLLFPKHRPKILTLFFVMLRGKSYLKKKSWKPNTTPGN